MWSLLCQGMKQLELFSGRKTIEELCLWCGLEQEISIVHSWPPPCLVQQKTPGHTQQNAWWSHCCLFVMQLHICSKLSSRLSCWCLSFPVHQPHTPVSLFIHLILVLCWKGNLSMLLFLGYDVSQSHSFIQVVKLRLLSCCSISNKRPETTVNISTEGIHPSVHFSALTQIIFVPTHICIADLYQDLLFAFSLFGKIFSEIRSGLVHQAWFICYLKTRWPRLFTPQVHQLACAMQERNSSLTLFTFRLWPYHYFGICSYTFYYWLATKLFLSIFKSSHSVWLHDLPWQ